MPAMNPGKPFLTCCEGVTALHVRTLAEEGGSLCFVVATFPFA